MNSFRVSLFFVYVAFCLINSAKSFEWPSHIPKCGMNTSNFECIERIISYLINNADDYSAFGMPNISPYKVGKPYSFNTSKTKRMFNLIANDREVVVHGCENLEVSAMRGFQPGPNMNRFEFTMFAPALKTNEQLHLTANFLPMSMIFSAVGSAETNIENVVVHNIVDCEVVERDEKQYVNIRNIRTNIASIGHYSMKFESPYVPPFVAKLLSRMCNANWKSLLDDIKPQYECMYGDAVKSFMDPIFNRIPLQDFYERRPVKSACACAPPIMFEAALPS